jgi:hypothetical protein
LKQYVEKKKKRRLPSAMDRTMLVDIILNRFDEKKLSLQELERIGKNVRPPAQAATGMYASWIPFVGKKLKEGDRKRGKKFAKKL